jgi:hypothetical protein
VGERSVARGCAGAETGGSVATDFDAALAEGGGGAEDYQRPWRRDRLNADLEVLALGVVDGGDRCAGAALSPPRRLLAPAASNSMWEVAED